MMHRMDVSNNFIGYSKPYKACIYPKTKREQDTDNNNFRGRHNLDRHHV